MTGENLLLIAILLPAAVGLLALAVGVRWRVETWLGLFGMAAEVVTALLLLGLVIDGEVVSLLAASTSALGAEFSVVFLADGLSVFFVLLVAVVGFVCALPALDAATATPFARYQPIVALLVTSALSAVFFSGNLLSLYFFWQLSIIALGVALVAGFRRGAVNAAAKFLILNELGAVLLLIATGTTYSSVSDQSLTAWLTATDAGVQTVTGICLLGAALVAVAAVPLHTWFADAGETVEPALAPFVMGVHGKAGLYLLARFALAGMEGNAVPSWTPALLVVAVLTVMLASINALARRDYRRLVALVAVAQVGFVLLGLASGERLGALGALFYLLVQSLALPLVAMSLALVGGGMRLYQKGGPALQPARLSVALVGFVVGAMTLVGLPPFGGAVGQTLIYQGLLAGEESWRGAVVVAGVIGSALTAAALARIGGRAFVGEDRVSVPFSLALGPAEAGVLLFAGLCLLLGFLPGLVIDPLLAPLAGLGASGAWDELAFDGGEAIWRPGLVAVLVVLPLAVWALTATWRGARRGGEVLPEEESARELAEQAARLEISKRALSLSAGDDLGSLGPVDSIFALGWWRRLQEGTSARSLDLYRLGGLVLAPVARVAARGLQLTFHLFLR